MNVIYVMAMVMEAFLHVIIVMAMVMEMRDIVIGSKLSCICQT